MLPKKAQLLIIKSYYNQNLMEKQRNLYNKAITIFYKWKQKNIYHVRLFAKGPPTHWYGGNKK